MHTVAAPETVTAAFGVAYAIAATFRAYWLRAALCGEQKSDSSKEGTCRWGHLVGAMHGVTVGVLL